MSSKDKTRDKLVDSMRTVKASDAAGSDEVQEEKKTGSPQKRAVKKKVSRKKITQKIESTPGDSYQKSPRVWPD